MTWFKPAAWGVVAGALATLIIGFTWGGWMTAVSAERMVADRSSASVTAALVPVCVEKAKLDPDRGKKLGMLKGLTSPWEQREAVVKDGWATVAGGEANPDVAEACAAQLVKVTWQ